MSWYAYQHFVNYAQNTAHSWCKWNPILCVYTVNENIKPKNLGCKLKELTRDNEHSLTTVLHRLSVPLQYQGIYCPEVQLCPWLFIRKWIVIIINSLNAYTQSYHLSKPIPYMEQWMESDRPSLCNSSTDRLYILVYT
jgi:hypothetical protein